jgi:signal peptidase I
MGDYMTKTKKIFKELLPYIVIIVTVVIIRTFVATPVIVNGSSMYPTLKNGQLLLLKKYDRSYKRFDIVVLDYKDEKLIKRIIGLPGEAIRYKAGELYINDKIIKDKFSSITTNFKSTEITDGIIPDGYYLVLGDNRTNSVDSRVIGLINKDDINGVTNLSLLPFKGIGK